MLLSIIIPLHNRSEEIQQLVATIPSRPDIEIIIIDDHSEVEIPHIKHDRVSFYPLPENMRYAGSARNYGLGKVTGRWICFADSDDLFEPLELTKLLSYLDEEIADIIFFRASSFLQNGEEGKRHKSVNRLFSLAKLGNTKALVNWYPPWSKIFKKTFLDEHQLAFSTTRVSNDVIFSAKSFLAASRFSFKDEIFYSVREGNDSLTTNQSFDDLSERFHVIIEFNDILHKQNMNEFKVPAFVHLRFILFSNPIFVLMKILSAWKRGHPVFFTKRMLFYYFGEYKNKKRK